MTNIHHLTTKRKGCELYKDFFGKRAQSRHIFEGKDKLKLAIFRAQVLVC
jgi:hypothetical protein